MPARKNRPNKHGVAGSKDPAMAMAQWAEQNPNMVARRIRGGGYVWEVMSAGFGFVGGFFSTMSWDVSRQRWAITHNSVYEPGSDRYEFDTIDAAVAWYKSLRANNR